VAVLVPEVFGRKLTSAAESKLAQWFRDQVGDDAVLLHSVGLVRHATKRWAEADFVLVCPDGVFCLEVKGGRVTRTAGEWSFTDRHGHVDTRQEGPFDQAGGAAGALQTWLADHDVRRDDGSRFQIGYAVMTPDCVLDMVGPDVEPELTYDERHIGAGLPAFISRIGQYWRKRKSFAPLSQAEVGRLCDAIRPDFEATMTRSLAVGVVEDELIRFTEEQLLVLDAVVDNPRILVRGSAGTGKSLLAAREARRLAAAGQSVLLVCHTRALADTLRSSVSDERVEVSTFASFAGRVVDKAGRRHELPDATEDALYEVFIPELASAILSADPSRRRFDAIVMDEAQDLLRGQAVDVLEHVLVDGFERGCWRVFLDPNQNLFGSVRREALLQLESGSPVSFRLNRNCRNTAQIVTYSGMLSGAMQMAESSLSGPKVRLCERWADPWADRVVSAVHEILVDGTSTDEVVVLVATRRQSSDLLAAAADLLSQRRTQGRILVSTISGFKGLEATAVVLAGPESLDEPYLRQLAYVGATRAKVVLWVVLPSYAKASFDRRVADYAEEIAARIRLESEPSS
jgi:hypothetical protein